MRNSRKNILALIDKMDYQLELQQNQVKDYQSSLKRVRIDHSGLLMFALLLPALAIGWKMSRGKWVKKIATQTTEVLTLTFLGYFRRQIANFLMNQSSK